MEVNRRKIDRVLVEASKNKVPAISAAIISSKEIIYKNSFGYSDLESKKPIAEDSVFRIASMTKAITSTCIMQLIEKGELSLQSKLRNFFPEVSGKKILKGFDSENNHIYEETLNDINIKHLLTHTSGFAYEIWNENIKKLVEKGELSSAFLGNDEFLKAPLVFNPGTDWTYGIGIDWLGVLIEKISGVSLQKFMTENIFKPLGMKDTAYDINDNLRERLVKIYGRSDQEYFEIPFTDPEKSSFYSGGGQLVSTVDDYSLFLRIFLNGGLYKGKQIISKESVKIMSKNHTGETLMTELKTSEPEFSNDVNFFPSITKSWGLGFMINNEAIPDGRAKNSLAWAGLFNSYFWIDKKNDMAAIIMMQMLPFFEEKAVQTLTDFEAAIYKKN